LSGKRVEKAEEANLLRQEEPRTDLTFVDHLLEKTHLQ
jgi:hypothetical protein